MPELTDRAEPRTLGDDGPQSWCPCGGLQQHLAAHREPHSANPVRIDVRPALQEGDRRGDVVRSLPAVGVGITGAAALPATVEKEHAVPVARQELGVPLRSFATRIGDHRG